MESKFGKNTRNPTSHAIKVVGGYGGKAKTGSAKTKLKSPKPKIEKLSQPKNEEKKIRKPAEKMNRIESKEQYTIEKQDNTSIPTWVRESSEKKPSRKEGAESKLQWRKETKKSQRSFSKNKERENMIASPRYQNDDAAARKPFGNTFEKKASTESIERKSSWDKNSKKPGTGFEKSKTGYKGVGSAWDKSAAPIVKTRKWDTDTEQRESIRKESKIGGYLGKKPTWDKKNTEKTAEYNNPGTKKTFQKSISEKKSPLSTPKSVDTRIKYIAPKPTWEKEKEILDKAKLKDPTKFFE